MNIRAVIRDAEREATYRFALAVVRLLEPDPAQNTSRVIGGKRCHTLDEAVRRLQECDRRN